MTDADDSKITLPPTPPRTSLRGPRVHGTAQQRTLAILTAVLALSATVLLSPVLLLAIQRIFRADWQVLSAIGQSYTGISTLFSAAALLGAVLTLRLQVRQSQVAQEHALRETQFHLLSLALQDEGLLDVVPTELADDASSESKRQYVFLTMGLRHLQFLHLAKELSEAALEGMLRLEFFGNPRARQHWALIRHLWTTEASSAQERNFVAAAERVWKSCGEAD